MSPLRQRVLDMIDLLYASILEERADAELLREMTQRLGNGSASRFNREEQRLIARHMRRAWEIRQRLSTESLRRQASWSPLQALPWGIAILDGQERVLFLNRIARSIIAGDDIFQLRHDRLFCKAEGQQRRLAAEISRAARWGTGAPDAHPGSTLILTAPGSGKKYGVTLHPLRLVSGRAVAGEPACLVFLSEPAQAPDLSLHRLKSLFDLTPTESQVALAIASGQSLEQCAARLGHSIATSRTLLKRVYAKTDTSRQNELANLLLTLGVGIAGPGDQEG